MAVNTKGKLEITDLDFDTIKTNLKTYLKGQTEFTDYDFEGSGLSVLLDILSYNTHYNAFMSNMLANEMFLNTAVKRNSVISHAKNLGYTPISAKAPIAYVDITVGDISAGSITMSAGHVFNTTVSGTSYQFVTVADKPITPTDGVNLFSNVDIYEGTYVTTDFTVNVSDADQKFILPNDNIDTSTISVAVQNSASDATTTTFTKSTTLVDVKSTTAAFFIQETVDGEWEIYFGDGVVGKALVDGNLITIKYVVTNKADANGANTFSAAGTIGGSAEITVAVGTAAANGAEPEGLAGIKYNAPFSYAAQNRAVTANDYKAIIPTLYSNIQSLAVWGGEFASPAVYGKVYASIKPKTGNVLTTATKNSIVSSLKDYKVASVTVEIVDPETIKIIPAINFKFNANATTSTASDLEALVTTAVGTFSDDNLEQFEGVFRYSKFIGTIDDVDTSIVSNITTVKISKEVTPTLSSATKYTIAFSNPLLDPDTNSKNLSSTGFIISGNSNTLFLDDDGAGIVRTYHMTGAARTYVDSAAGTIDYGTGEIVITALNITSVYNSDGTITITVIPTSNDIVPVRNQILEIDSTNQTITGVADTIASGSSNAGTDYTTTSSYN